MSHQRQDSNLHTVLACHVLRLAEDFRIKILKHDHSLIFFPRRGEHDMLQAAWASAQQHLKTVMAIALAEMGMRRDGTCKEEPLICSTDQGVS